VLNSDVNRVEQLEGEVSRLRAAFDAERALADQLAEALCQAVSWACCGDSHFGPCACPPDSRRPEGAVNDAAITAWQEARRG
jgi:hypothetical protein